ncbi:hypothetical protein AG1IA_01987 [Rhizoctonia solani AG-1 IA]|uniref:Uncharacterized protein n=1 Tax=Thanatephorus cucumeris (strain AG1-IA) TaxID=983506 RepID=L8X0Z4_THACA|nr:hypothetical protein AG1IA_01987 [Rhizoctonia solani AG-1 IA]
MINFCSSLVCDPTPHTRSLAGVSISLRNFPTSRMLPNFVMKPSQNHIGPSNHRTNKRYVESSPTRRKDILRGTQTRPRGRLIGYVSVRISSKFVVLNRSVGTGRTWPARRRNGPFKGGLDGVEAQSLPFRPRVTLEIDKRFVLDIAAKHT